jgi:hypothetical protein
MRISPIAASRIASRRNSSYVSTSISFDGHLIYSKDFSIKYSSYIILSLFPKTQFTSSLWIINHVKGYKNAVLEKALHNIKIRVLEAISCFS